MDFSRGFGYMASRLAHNILVMVTEQKKSERIEVS